MHGAPRERVGLASGARVNHAKFGNNAPAGYTGSPGKCTGSWIELWSDGHFAHYGEDHHINDLDDCADTCDSHNECAGFYSKDGKCSHWRSGDITVVPQDGHICYMKDGGSFLETDAESEEEEDWSISIGGHPGGGGGGGWHNGGGWNNGPQHHHHHHNHHHGMGWHHRHMGMGMGWHHHMGMGMGWHMGW